MTTSTTENWTIQRLLQWTTTHFAGKGIESGRLDSELLLAHVLNCKRLDLYLKFDQPLQAKELGEFKQLVIRRSQREPTAYILGRQDFFSRPFAVESGVLIPRPETEHLVSEANSWIKKQPLQNLSVLDIGSGSGAIGVTLACENPEISVTSVDVSPVAMAMTTKNATLHGVEKRMSIEQSPFLEWGSKQLFDVVVSNPPYIALSQKEKLMTDVSRYEPSEALFGGAEGHELLLSWLPKMSELLKPRGLLLCEIGYDQKEKVLEKAKELNCFQESKVIADYSGHPRVFYGQKKSEEE